MKKFLFTFLILFFYLVGWGQIITTNPTFITKDYVGEIEIIYDATQGTAGLKNYTGDVYAHTGVITSASTSPSDWKHAPTWLDNSPKYKLTSLGSNKWKLLITPNMTGYYNLNAGEVVQKLAFVFRNATGTLQGKDVGGADIFVPVYDSGLNVAFTSPVSNQFISVGTVINFTVSSSLSAELKLMLNNNILASQSSATSLTHSYSYSFINTGDYTLVASAKVGNNTVYDTLQVCVPEPVANQARPANTKPGINYIDNTTVTLVLHAPNKNNVFLIGEFNDWSQLNAYQLKKDGEYWWITLTGLTPGKIYAYQYLVDGTIRSSDPYTELVLDPWNDKWINEYRTIYPNLKPYPEGKTEGLVATFQTAKPDYNWEITNFSMPAKENLVIYEMLLRDFTTEKSLQAAIGKLDYLKNLGITAVELMPIQEFDGNNSWGYNPNHYFAPDKAYGTPEMYKKFIDECHKRGMAVILDMVFNQASGICPFALLYWDSTNNRPAANNPWMNPVAPHQFSVLNDFNHSYSGTKEYFKRVLQYWITEYKVDGYRMDLTKGFTQNSGTESTWDQTRINNLKDYYYAVTDVKPDALFILEHFVGGSEEDYLAAQGMYLWRNLNNAYSQAAMGFQSSSDFSGMSTSPRRWVGYAESHDEERNFYKAKAFGNGTVKTDSLYRVSRVPMVVAFATLMPGPKMLWQFEEMGYDYSIESNGGRTNPKPHAWGWLNLPHRKAAADASAKIISLRKLYPNAFLNGNYSLQVAYSDWSQGKRIALSHADLNMVVLGNFQSDASITANPSFQSTGTWYNLLTDEALNVSNTNMTLNMQPGQLLIFTDRKVDFLNENREISYNVSDYVYPTLTSGKLFVSSTGNIQSIRIYNLQGSLLKQQNTDIKEIDLSMLKKGFYLVELETANGKSAHKIIKE
ncbi:MAG: T9SS type A sorting domain-containing protein [Paludibacteraceae bacterium]|nr:T9SS type A sorting domain-containing protein [Paludibacteraceae bacterium]